MQIGIVTDSTSDLPPQILKKYQIESIPAIVVNGGEQFRDSVDLSRKEYYQRLPDINPPPTTASPAPGTYEETYRDIFDKGADHIISIHAASDLSAIHDTAKLVSKGFGSNVTVVDSQQLSLGLGFQVLEAIKAAKKGLEIPEIIARIENIRGRLQVHAMLDTMEQLKRSGRVSWAQAGFGSFLKLKLFIELKEGQVLREGQARSRRRAINSLKDRIRSYGEIEQFAILHTNAEQDAKNILKELDLSLDEDPFIINVTTVIGTHVGVNALGFVAVLK